MPYLSVIVPVYNSQKTIEKCLRAVRGSNCRDYELIVVDSGSEDKTLLIAEEYADKVIELDGAPGRSRARDSGIKTAKGEILVNIDSDIVIRPDTLTRIINYFSKHPRMDALNGLLSKEHPDFNFFSQYKNLYMHYIFSKLPERVTFLYGSIHAMRRQAAQPYGSDIKIADDTALGQQLVAGGKQIALVKELEVIHLKKYNLFSFFKNDFQIPFDWAKIFIRYKGWRQLGKYQTGYAHSPKEQLLSVILAPAVVLLSLTAWTGHFSFYLIFPLILAWFLLNLGFIGFLAREKSLFFGAGALFVTFLDNIVMASGILCGLAAFLISDIKSR